MSKTQKAPLKEARPVVDALERYLDFLARTPEERERERALVDQAIGSLTPEHPVWKALMLLIKSHWHIEHESARNPLLTNEQMRYQLGREAMLEDLRGALAQIMARTRPRPPG